MKRFTVLGYSANDDVWCLACLRAATGLNPDDADYEGRPILPLYAGEPAVLEEVCNYCRSPLLDLLMQAEAARVRAPAPVSATFSYDVRGLPTIRFPERPPADARAALKASRWRWDPRAVAWVHADRGAVPPTGIPVPPPPPVVKARPPVIRRRAALASK